MNVQRENLHGISNAAAAWLDTHSFPHPRLQRAGPFPSRKFCGQGKNTALGLGTQRPENPTQCPPSLEPCLRGSLQARPHPSRGMQVRARVCLFRTAG